MSRESEDREIQLAAQFTRQRLNVTGLASTLEQRAFLALLADRDRLAAELARVRRNHLRRMGTSAILRSWQQVDPGRADALQLFAGRCLRAALATMEPKA